jgi:hypothetical protein
MTPNRSISAHSKLMSRPTPNEKTTVVGFSLWGETNQLAPRLPSTRPSTEHCGS